MQTSPAQTSPVRAGRRAGAAPWASFALLAFVALSLIAGLFLVYQTIEAERAQREQVRKTDAVLLQLRNVSRAARNAETGERGYLITLDRRYLDPYREGRERIGPAIAALRDGIGDAPTERQAYLLDQIERLAAVKFAELDQTVALAQEGRLLDARRQVLTDDGQQAMTRLQAAIRELEEIETGFLNDALTEAVRTEARVMPLLSGIVVLLVLALAMGFRLAVRTARAEAEAAQASALSEARDRADLLARELNHRVKNLFAVILAIVRMGGKEAPEARAATERMAERINALLTAHEVSQGALGSETASLGTLVETTLAPYLSDRLTATHGGPDVLLPAKRATPLGLVLHELTTNAVKYGCWREQGLLEVSWTLDGDDIRVHWREHCRIEPQGEPQSGFGTRLMEASARQLRGTIDRKIHPDGAEVVIAFPASVSAEHA